MAKSLTEICQKLRAKVLWDAGHRTPKSMFRRGNIPERSAKRYISAFRHGQYHTRKPYPKRVKVAQKRAVVQRVVRKAQTRKRFYSLRDMAIDNDISHMTVKSILRRYGFNYSSYKKRFVLTDKAKKARLRFARKMQRQKSVWKKTYITDECSFWLSRSQPGKIWTQDPLQETGGGTHGEKVHCWGAICANGAVSIEMFTENLTAERYIDILESRQGEMNELMPDGWVFQHDGSGVHRADIVKDYIDEEVEDCVAWPAYSPDLSPIENIWGWLKKQVSKDAPRHVEALKSSIERHWDSIDEEFLRPYFDTMPMRMQMVIENLGGKIKY